MRGYLELRTTFTDGTASRTENIRYLVVNASSAYNMLGRPTLNRLGAVPSTGHMKMKLLDLTGKVITIKSYQKEVKRCYENNLKTRRGISMVTSGPPYTEEVPLPGVSRVEPDKTIAEIARGIKVSKLSNILSQTAQGLVEKIVECRLKPGPEVFGRESGKPLGSLLIERGTETVPAGTEMNPERRVSVLSRFTLVGGGGDLPYQGGCKKALIRLKGYLANPPILCKPQPSTSLSWYPVMINQAINSVFVQKQNQFQELIHRGSRVCQGLEERHQVLEKAVPLVSRQVSPAWTVSFRMT